jgi:anti-anti-sigma factor
VRPGEADLDVDSADGRMTVTLRGELDLGTVPTLELRLRDALAASPRELVLDLGAVTFLDSTGTSLLFRLASESAVHRRRLVVVAPPGGVAHRLLSLVAFSQAAPVLDALPAPPS